MASGLRISGGSRRGRRLFSPPKNSIRPASDLVRQAVFNMLGAAIQDAYFYDVFAGTGIVGLEALSRGAARVVFVERDRRQIDLIRKNIAHVGFGPEAMTRTSDAFFWAAHFVADLAPNIVFVGPPFPLFAAEEDRLLEMVASLQSRLKPGDQLVFQFPRALHDEKLPRQDGWRRIRAYGKTKIGVWEVALEVPGPSGDLSTADGEGL